MNLEELRKIASAATQLRAQVYEAPNDQAIHLAWQNPWEMREEMFASFWWPAHPSEATQEAERIFEATARHIEAFGPDTALKLLDILDVMSIALAVIGSQANACVVSAEEDWDMSANWVERRARLALARVSEILGDGGGK